MNTLQYLRKKRQLRQATVLAVNALLQDRQLPAGRQLSVTDVKRTENYILLIQADGGWAFCITDAVDRIVLAMHYGYGRVLEISGIRYGDAGRIIHVDTVPNEHTLGILKQLLGQWGR